MIGTRAGPAALHRIAMRGLEAPHGFSWLARTAIVTNALGIKWSVERASLNVRET